MAASRGKLAPRPASKRVASLQAVSGGLPPALLPPGVMGSSLMGMPPVSGVAGSVTVHAVY